jgi:leader peptidase (prepilin peptidase) / N-methyltransferase
MLINQIFLYLCVFIFGSIVGSFLNVLVLRYNTGLSAVKGRSFCFSCRKTLGASELIPVFSFLFQKGKCKGCQSKISWQYPTVEALTGFLFVAIFLKYFGFYGLTDFIFIDIKLIYYIIISLCTVALLTSITVYDIKHKIIPDGLVIAFSILALAKILTDYLLLGNGVEQAKERLIWFLVGGPALALPLFLIWLFSRGRWMGLGDPKLVLGIGWFLGPILGLSAVILAFWSGALYGIVLIILSKFKWHGLNIHRKTEVPFAPFLILGFLLVLFFEIDLLNLAFLIP